MTYFLRDEIEFDASGRDANGFACCQHCGYPFFGAKCPNPACRLNRTDAQNAADDAARAARAAEEAERAKLREIRARAMEPRKADFLTGLVDDAKGLRRWGCVDQETGEVLSYVKRLRAHWAAYTGSDRLLRRGLTEGEAKRVAMDHARTR